MPADAALVNALRDDLRDAWRHLRAKYPAERFYAFGLYTTEAASYFSPFACGEEGLGKVAAAYVRRGSYAGLEVARQALRWSIADSPYHDRLPSQRIDAALAVRPDPTDPNLPETKCARETRERLNAAVAALQELDREGLFGKERSKLTVLIEAGDRENEFVLKWAKKLNPAPIFRAYADLGRDEEVGRWSEFGAKKVYETTHLATSADRRLVATASQYVGCIFDVAANKQLLCRPIPNKKDYQAVCGVALSADGGRIAFVSGDDTPPRHLTVLDGPRWQSERTFPLPAQPLSFAGSPKGDWYAIGSTDKLVRVYSAHGQLHATLSGHAAWPRELAVSATGTRLASIDEKSGVRVWDTVTWTLLQHIPTAKGTAVDFDPTGRCVATVRRWGRLLKDPDGEILRITEVASGRTRLEHRRPGFSFDTVRYSPDGHWLVCGVENLDDCLDHQAVVMSAANGALRERLRGPFDCFTDFAFLPSRNAIAVAARGHTRRPLLLWQVSSS